MTVPIKQRPPFRAEHLGSLLRPKELVDARYAAVANAAEEQNLEKLEDRCIRNIVQTQRDCGFHAVGDGEYRRHQLCDAALSHQFWGRFFETLHGMKEIQTGAMKGYDASTFREYAPDVRSFLHDKVVPNSVTICVSKISHSGISSYTTEVAFMQSLLPEEEWKNMKLTLASPSWYHFRYKSGGAFPPDVYASDEDYFADVAKAYSTELQILYAAGVRNVQVDDPNLAYFCDESLCAGWAADEGNNRTVDEMFELYIKAYNECFQRPADMHLGIHLCRGNYMGSKHFSEGAYDRIAKKLFGELNVDTFYLEYDTPRAGGFEPLKFLPRNKNVILGVVTSKFAQLENKEAMVARVKEAADFVAQGGAQTQREALERIGVSPQCGFASHAEGNAIVFGDMVNKLRLIRAIANDLWPGQP